MPLAKTRLLNVPRYALFFNGVNDYIRVNDSPSLNPQGPFTIIFSMKSNVNFVGTNGPVIIDKRGTEASGYAVYNWNDGFVISVFLSGILYYNAYPIDWDVTQWHSYVAIWNGTHTILYVDIIKKDSKPASGTMGINTLPLYIGVYQGTSFWLNGFISEVLLYSRVLSQDEIQWNYNYPENPVRNGLVLWLLAHPNNIKDIDGDGILEWLDLSGFNNHGKIYGAVLQEIVKAPTRILTPTRIQSPVR